MSSSKDTTRHAAFSRMRSAPTLLQAVPRTGPGLPRKSRRVIPALVPAFAGALALSACQTISRFDPPAGGGDPSSLQQMRLEMPAVRDVLQGAILFLYDTQVRDRPGRGSSAFDWCGDREAPDGPAQSGTLGANEENERPRPVNAVATQESCRPRLFVSLPTSQRLHGIPSFGLDNENRVGEWNAVLGVVPKIPGNDGGRLFVGVQDSNMFVSTGVGYSLLHFEAPSDGALSEMVRLARDNIAGYRRGEGYAFWPPRPAITGAGHAYRTTHPPNVRVDRLERYARIFVEDPAALGGLTMGVAPDQWFRFLRWMQVLLDESANPHGIESATNIPGDLDDTSLAVAFGTLDRRLNGPPDAGRVEIDEEVLSALPRFRDLNRAKEDGQDAWKGADSGAFLTWLKDENAPAFSRPDQGIIPLGVNNVDCVVNANALLALSLTGRTNTPGYDDALRLMVRAIETEAWPECGLYYPQKMMFPYALSRAWRDGGARSPALDAALGVLVHDVLDQQSPDGSFDGGFDRSRDLSTALAVATLLNLGEETASSAGLDLAEYRHAIESGLQFLYRHRRAVPTRNRDTFASLHGRGGSGRTALSWEPGIVFADNLWNLMQWRSEAYTTAIVLEAFARYALAYDRQPAGISEGPRIQVDAAGMEFRVED